MRLLVVFFLFLSTTCYGNDSTKLYNPAANVAKDVAAALLKAKKEKKNVILQIGGNWCVWCYRLNSFIQTDSILRKLTADNYVDLIFFCRLYHLNHFFFLCK